MAKREWIAKPHPCDSLTKRQLEVIFIKCHLIITYILGDTLKNKSQLRDAHYIHQYEKWQFLSERKIAIQTQHTHYNKREYKISYWKNIRLILNKLFASPLEACRTHNLWQLLQFLNNCVLQQWKLYLLNTKIHSRYWYVSAKKKNFIFKHLSRWLLHLSNIIWSQYHRIFKNCAT